MLGKREPPDTTSTNKAGVNRTATDERTRASASAVNAETMRSLQTVAPVDHHPGTDVLRHIALRPDTLPKRSIGFDQKIVAMYAQGLSERAIHDVLSSMYSSEVSPSYIKQVMDAMTIEVATWQNRPLPPLYPLIFLDALRVIVCDGSAIQHKVACLGWGILPEGTRDFLGVWIGQTGGGTLWPKMLSDLRARGVEDILIAVVDGLQGTLEANEVSGAIGTIFPVTMVQTDILQLIRHSLEQASHSDRKAVADALRPLYTAQTIQAAREALGEFAKGAFGVRYPTIVQRWQQSWENISPFLRLPPEVRRLIHATAVIENLRARVRRVIKARGHFAGDDAARRQLWLTLRNSTTHRVRSKSEWKAATTQFVALYGDRFSNPS